MPYQLIYREGQWYLLAEYHQKVHVFLLEDIQSVKPLSSTFIPQKISTNFRNKTVLSLRYRIFD
ncbi:WYL domain-containing protein [Providencia stuartii]|uniref:WYL domain-containing protein n=1 Tax=Providencia stuartii TaxID=588 RepID=UPI00215B5F1B